MKSIPEPVSFQWDSGNTSKNKEKHNVLSEEVEQVFFDQHKKQFKDELHTTNKEKWYILIGKTKNNRILFVVYTIRNKMVRVISARDLNRKEQQLYEKST